MPLLVTGSIGIDTVTTPYGVSENCLGGSAVYFSIAASFFSPVRVVGVVLKIFRKSTSLFCAPITWISTAWKSNPGKLFGGAQNTKPISIPGKPCLPI